MNTLHQIEIAAHQERTSGLREKRLQSTERIHLLSVGSFDRSFVLYDALQEATCCHLSMEWNRLELWMIADYRELWIIPKHEEIQLSILHDTLPPFELGETAGLIRHRWPQARILVIRGDGDFLEDTLYDARVIPPVARETLITTIKQLTETGHEREQLQQCQGTVKGPSLTG